MPEIHWRHYAENKLAPIRRKLTDTTHQGVWGGNVIMTPEPGNITGATHNNPDGTSEHKPS